jgi:GNAT superfamily N-acetyltransferase
LTTKGTIRRFRLTDAEAASAVICNTLLVSNSADYHLEVLRGLAHGFSAQALRAMSRKRRIWVYEEEGRIAATVALEGDTVSGFFVAPDRQGRGIGRRLLSFVEARARREGLRAVCLSASLTAAGFYQGLGYARSGDGSGEDVVPMRKVL